MILSWSVRLNHRLVFFELVPAEVPLGWIYGDALKVVEKRGASPFVDRKRAPLPMVAAGIGSSPFVDSARGASPMIATRRGSAPFIASKRGEL